jgi:hypothetical protein
MSIPLRWSFILLALVTASAAIPHVRDIPPRSLAFATHFNTEGFANIAEANRARAKFLQSAHASGQHIDRRAISFNITNTVVRVLRSWVFKQ